MGKKAKAGLIGLGMMGHGIAYNLIKGGYALTFLDHPGNQPAGDMIAAGALSVKTGKALAARSDTIIICVTGTPEVEDVLLREDGVLSGLNPAPSSSIARPRSRRQPNGSQKPLPRRAAVSSMRR